MPSLDIRDYRFTKRGSFRLKDCDTAGTNGFHDKKQARSRLLENVAKMAELQDRFYAQDRESLLLIFQAMDSAGKDGAVKHVMSGLNPQGVKVVSFKQPSAEELDHDYLWRVHKALPGRGEIGIFNRSYYEEVLVGKVHNLPFSQKLPARCLDDRLWERRYRQLRHYEEYLTENGITVVKFFLNISKEEQRLRFLDRIDDETKNWKFSAADIAERAHWDEYMDAYEQAINQTAAPYAPWYVIPADKKWFARLLISEIVIHHLKKLDPQYPEVGPEQKAALLECRKQLEEK
ncbi:MAG TPA: polyphosphate kinase 2 family protein [Firmicutes bacterium]|nr:polyphosphate kinase 2 family protein [Bacillota bacterium]